MAALMFTSHSVTQMIISQEGRREEQNPFGSNVMAFTSPEDLMKNLPKAMGNISKMMGGGKPAGLTDTPTFKISMKEYEDIGIKVGDRVTIEVKSRTAREFIPKTDTILQKARVRYGSKDQLLSVMFPFPLFLVLL